MWQGMTDDIAERLEQLGVDTDGMDSLIEGEAIRAYNYVLCICNIERMPDILMPVCVDMACAAIISTADRDGTLKVVADSGLKSIKEGDITLQFDNTVLSELADILIKRLDFNDKSLLISYRRLKW